MSLRSINNYIRVSDRIASSGQPEEMQFRTIAEAGFQVVINLAMPNSENALPDEGHIVTARRMAYVHIPVPFGAPTVEHLRQFCGVMQAFATQRCWVHCVVNKRVSAFLYQYQRLVLGRSDAQARGAVLPGWEPDAAWQRFMAYSADDVW